MTTLTAKLKHEFMKVLPPTVFFFVILHIVVIVRSLMVLGTGVSIPTSASVLVASLILGKAVLLADMLPFINRFPDKPLIWNVAWKTLMYAVVATVIHYLERLFEAWRETHSVLQANAHLLAEMNWPRFWGLQIMLVTLIFNYCVIAELARVIGRKKLSSIFFGPIHQHAE